MEEKELKSLLDQVIANQTVLYDMIRVLASDNKTKPKRWVVDDFKKKAEEFKSLL